MNHHFPRPTSRPDDIAPKTIKIGAPDANATQDMITPVAFNSEAPNIARSLLF